MGSPSAFVLRVRDAQRRSKESLADGQQHADAGCIANSTVDTRRVFNAKGKSVRSMTTTNDGEDIAPKKTAKD